MYNDRASIADAQMLAIDTKVADHNIDFTRLLYILSQDMDNLIRQADTKAQIVLGVNAIVAATGVAGDSLSGQILSQGVSVWVSSATVLTFFMLLSILASIFFALYTANPRVTKEKAANPFFFGTINKMSQTDYVNYFQELTLQDVKTAVMKEIHAKSFIVEAKFVRVQRSVNFLFLAIFLWTLSRALFTIG